MKLKPVVSLFQDSSHVGVTLHVDGLAMDGDGPKTVVPVIFIPISDSFLRIKILVAKHRVKRLARMALNGRFSNVKKEAIAPAP